MVAEYGGLMWISSIDSQKIAGDNQQNEDLELSPLRRRIMFGPLMQSEPSSLHLRCQSEEELAQVPPVSRQIATNMHVVLCNPCHILSCKCDEASMQYDLDPNKVKILED